MTGPGQKSLAVGAARQALRAGARPVKGALRRAWRDAVRLSSRDDTTAAASRRCLVLAPHPDDETIGCGATIARKRAAGTDVRVVLATDGRFSHASPLITADDLAQVRLAEFAEACSRLGIAARDRVVLGIEENALGTRLHETAAQLRRQIDDFRPDEILVTSARDWHVDHRMLNHALRLALDGAPALVREYPVWAWVDGPWLNPPGRSVIRSAADLIAQPVVAWRAAHPTYVRTGPYLERKRDALAAYRSQLSSLTGEPGWATFDEAFLQLFLTDRETFLTPEWGSR